MSLNLKHSKTLQLNYLYKTWPYSVPDRQSLALLSPYLAASPSISYFTIGTYIKVRNVIIIGML